MGRAGFLDVVDAPGEPVEFRDHGVVLALQHLRQIAQVAGQQLETCNQGAAQLKLAASSELPLPLYFATFG